MADKLINAQIRHKRDSASNWESANPILGDGEIGWDITNKRGKVGDGTTTWSLLPYIDAEILTSLGLKEPLIKNATVETTIVDTDKIPFTDVSTDNDDTKGITLGNLKTNILSNVESELDRLVNTSGTNTGDETATRLGTLINGALGKTTPANADLVGLVDSTDTIIKKLSWSNIKATLKTYFDTLYNNYVHPTGDGNLHVPPNSTANEGKVLTAGATAGAYTWEEAAGGAEVVSLTKAEYNALATKDPDTYYYITDELVYAISVLYSNANSSLEATQVQAAIDELADDLDITENSISDLEDEVLNIKRTPTTLKTGDFTFALEDEGGMLLCSSANDIVATLDTNDNVAFPNDATIVIIRYGEGEVTITPKTNVVLNGAEAAIAISSQYTAVTLKQIVENEWLIIGAI